MNRLRVSPEALAKRGFLRRALAGSSALLVGGCDRLAENESFTKLLSAGEALSRGVHDAVGRGGVTLAQEFTKADLSPSFRGNGNTDPESDEYKAMVANGFADWRLVVDGLVDAPASLSLAELRSMPSRTQITRHDCVEGWSAIGQWTGVPLGQVLDRVKAKPNARYVVFHCADSLERDDSRYYESIYLSEAYHPQSILAYDMNDAVLGIPYGAPLRVRLERKLGYKMAKYIVGLQLVVSLDGLGGGNGGYWEDRGYQWHGGI